MHINSNEVLTQNQLAMGGVTHKLIYMLKPFNFLNVGQHPLLYSLYFNSVGQYSLSYSNIPPHIDLLTRLNMCTQFFYKKSNRDGDKSKSSNPL